MGFALHEDGLPGGDVAEEGEAEVEPVEFGESLCEEVEGVGEDGGAQGEVFVV